ncbi:sulfurtransferase complex subunit TusD [Cellvibrio sp. PSBB006]|uniref:sulfurtransferase complex subunit TusD n=1 Tax=Cellvibrio sp. PSBB006 TaxID=1987723 RepID=UPI000B3B3354|nr:sulfurtransferase complex subunit TusD [Cellvibrio sp. PSBB006]ARU26312.1 sulfurtransferase TusD [Cellvibrio sp. PSBB006]
MIFSLAIYSAPHTTQASDSAYRFAETLLSEGHSLYRVFFYQDGVYNSNNLITPAQDETDLSSGWQQLSAKYQIDMVVCIAAALKRGILNQEEAERYEKPAHNLRDGFAISGLGQLVDAALMSDRLITFGG